MGSCWCKQKDEDHDTYVPQAPANHNISTSVVQQPVSPDNTQYSFRVSNAPDPSYVDRLVLDTLDVIATLVDK